MKKIKLPLRAIAAEIRFLHERHAGMSGKALDIRLQVYPSGSWAIHHGPSDCLDGSSGVLAAARVEYGPRCAAVAVNYTQLARALINECVDHAACEPESLDAGVALYYAPLRPKATHAAPRLAVTGNEASTAADVAERAWGTMPVEARRALEAVGLDVADVASDLARVRAGGRDALLVECLDGADDSYAAAWREYVEHLDVLASLMEVV